jgi:riboflavin kinase/FMN adenylyltransferase
MEYIEITKSFPRLTNCAITLGKFDGVHHGHRKLIEKILKQKENGAKAVLFAFVTRSSMILTRQERRELLEEMGVDILLECPLNEKIRHMKAEAFVREILVGDLHVSYVAVGEDFRFGHERKGTPALLCELGKKYGFETEILSKEMDGHRKISSTYIREELKHGNMEKISSLLECDFSVEGIVEHGRGMGHKYLFPTANLQPPAEKLMPPNGVYVTESYFETGTWQGITNIGYKPTVGEKFLGVETYLFGCDEDLYGQKCTVRFKKFLRPEQKFASLELLKEQLQRDIVAGKAYFEKKRR